MALWSAAALTWIGCSAAACADTVASLLGNFTVNQFCAVSPGRGAVAVHYAVVFGQLPALRELHAADANGDGITSQAERDAYVGTLAPHLATGLELRVDGTAVPLRAVRWSSSLPTEQGGFSLRLDVDFSADAAALGSGGTHSLQLSNRNHPGSIGWHEIVVTPAPGIAVFATNAYSTSATGGLTEALQALPAAGPLDERTVAMSVSAARMPAGAAGLGPRPPAGLPVVRAPGGADNRWITQKTRQLVDSIAGPRLEPRVAVLAVLAALLLGAVHALAPGHGKTIVGAYLIGSRGTPRHAVFLGLTVTATHTLGVFALGFLTLYASRFIVPERLFPLLGLVSALLVLGMGLALLVQRTRAAGRRLGLPWVRRATVYRPFVLLAHTADIGTWHSHGGGAPHSHLPPGAGGERVTWRSLLTLGISGGLVPCPSAMVLLLAAIALNKTAYGMLLVLVFSIGLALTLTAVGLVFLYARSRFPRPSASARWPHWLPVLSAATITLVGVALSVGALKSL